jgi:osmotically inducible protein OsmC
MKPDDLVDESIKETFPASDPPAVTARREPARRERTMAISRARAEWRGTLKDGKGTMAAGSGAFDVAFSYKSRFEGDTSATNPEELIGAAHAGCFSMFLAAQLAKAGHPPVRVTTEARVHLGSGPSITTIELETEAEVPGIDETAFIEHVEFSKKQCPVSQALSAVPSITIAAKLVSPRS